jgi:hypothetical protein
MFSNDVSPERVAEHWVRKSTFILNEGVEYRKAHADAKFTDIFYEDLVKDSSPVMEMIYRDAGGISDDLRKRILSTEKENPPGKYGRHNYSLNDFGLSKEDIEKRIVGYREMMGEVEKPKI